MPDHIETMRCCTLLCLYTSSLYKALHRLYRTKLRSSEPLQTMTRPSMTAQDPAIAVRFITSPSHYRTLLFEAIPRPFVTPSHHTCTGQYKTALHKRLPILVNARLHFAVTRPNLAAQDTTCTVSDINVPYHHNTFRHRTALYITNTRPRAIIHCRTKPELHLPVLSHNITRHSGTIPLHDFAIHNFTDAGQHQTAPCLYIGILIGTLTGQLTIVPCIARHHTTEA